MVHSIYIGEKTTQQLETRTQFLPFCYLTRNMSKRNNPSEMIMAHYIRNHFESKRDRKYIPIALKHIILKFARKFIGSNLLSPKRDLAFLEMLTAKLSDTIKFNLLYRASEHGHYVKGFHSFCDNKGPTLTIIESDHGNIFGGYTSKSWTSTKDGYVKDQNAFLFLIECNKQESNKLCPLLFDIKTGCEDQAIYNYPKFGPVFGNGNDIFVAPGLNHTDKGGYEYGKFDLHLSGNSSHKYGTFEVIDFEVFKLD